MLEPSRGETANPLDIVIQVTQSRMVLRRAPWRTAGESYGINRSRLESRAPRATPRSYERDRPALGHSPDGGQAVSFAPGRYPPG
jgi:hypothetical protein